MMFTAFNVDGYNPYGYDDKDNFQRYEGFSILRLDVEVKTNGLEARND